MSGPWILPVELVGETCLYNVGNHTTQMKIQFQNSQNQQQLLRWAFKAHMIDVGWVFGEGFVEEVNFSYARKGS